MHNKPKLNLAIHSVVDLITNSSTEMFIDFSDSIEPCKEMINEIFKSCNIEKTCDEVFDISLQIDDSYDDGPATLIIEAKDPQFENLSKLIKRFLESVETKECYN